MPSPEDIDWQELVMQFVRTFTHDLRNDLNAMSLQILALADSVDGPDTKKPFALLRQQIQQTNTRLNELSEAFKKATVQPAAAPAEELFHLWQGQASQLGIAEIDWKESAGPGQIH